MHVLMDALIRLRVCMHMQCAENIIIASAHSVTQKLFCRLCLSVIWPKANRICVIVQMKHLLDINKPDFLNIICFKKHTNPLITSKSIARNILKKFPHYFACRPCLYLLSLRKGEETVTNPA